MTRDEISEVITHMAFYGGWPVAANAVRVAKGGIRGAWRLETGSPFSQRPRSAVLGDPNAFADPSLNGNTR